MAKELKTIYRIPEGTSILVREQEKGPATRITTRKDIDLEHLPKPRGRQYEVVVSGFYLTVPQQCIVRIDPQQRLF